MKDLLTLANECMKEFDNLNINYGYVVKWKVNSRAQHRWGICKKRDGIYTIEISNRLLEDDVPTIKCKETICHELAHTVDGCMNHGTKWKNVTSRLNNAYGYNISRTASSASLGVVEKPIIHKYNFQCSNCGARVYRDRATDFVKRYDVYGCGRCHTFGNFKMIEV